MANKNFQKNFDGYYASSKMVEDFWSQVKRDLIDLEIWDISVTVQRDLRRVIARDIPSNKQNFVDNRLRQLEDTYHINTWTWQPNGDLYVYIKRYENW